MRGADRVISIPQRSFDEVELADKVQRDACVASGRILNTLRLARLIKLSSGLRETSRARRVLARRTCPPAIRGWPPQMETPLDEDASESGSVTSHDERRYRMEPET
jgi:hypothetical protein